MSITMKSSRFSSLQLIGRLSYSQKFTVITLVFLIPVLAFMPLVSNQLTNINRYGVSELSGTIYLRSLWNVSENVRDYITLAHEYAEGKAQQSDVTAVEARVETSFEGFSRIHSKYGPELNVSDGEETIRKQWQDVKAAVQRAEWTILDAKQSALFEGITNLTSTVGDTSYLILDPDLDTYYMMDTVLIKAPENQSLIFQAYRLTKQGMENGSFSVEQRTALLGIVGRLQANIGTMKRNIGVAVQNDRTGKMQQIISAPLIDYQTTLDTFTQLVSQKLDSPFSVESSNAAQSIEDLKSAYENVDAADSQLYGAASQSLEQGIQNRIDTLQQRLIWMAIVALFSILSAFLIGRSMMRSISRPLAALIGATKRLSTGDMSSRVAIKDAGEIGQVGIAFNQMAAELERDKTDLLTRSEELASARNQIEKRASQLQTVSSLARTIALMQDLDMLLPNVTQLVSEQFGYHHIGIFLLGSDGKSAVLQAANSEGGRNMLSRGYQLALDSSSIVGYAMSKGEPRVASDVGTNAVHLINPDLPETRSEMALPLRVSGQVIGALDVHSTNTNAFSEDDVLVLSTLADQIAIAIENARLFGNAQAALAESQSTFERYLKQEWTNFTQQARHAGFTFDGKQVVPLDTNTRRELTRSAIQTGNLVREKGATSASVSVPVKLRGQTIGVIDVRYKKGQREWTRQEIALLEAAAERAALALENARLLESAQKRAARERAIGEISTRIGAFSNIDTILQTAVEELGRKIGGGTEVTIQLGNGDKQDALQV